MSSAFADRMVALEKRMLDRFGANGTLESSGDIYDPVTRRVVDGSATRRTVRMTVGPSETLDENGREVFRTVATMQVEPVRGQKLTFAGKPYTIGNVRTLYEGDTPVIYIAEVI